MYTLYIVGFGLGDRQLLTDKAKRVIDGADRVLTTGKRIFNGVNEAAKYCTLAELNKELENKVEGTTVVLVSGDCGFFSVSKNIVKNFSELYRIELINGISSVQYLSGKLGVSYDDAVICSMHGRNEAIVSKVSYNKKVFALTGGDFKAHDICGILCKSGLSDVRVWIGEWLSYPDERIAEGTAAELKSQIFSNLSVMYIENKGFVNPYKPLNDEDFIRGDVPMTKAEVRWLSIQKLGVMPTDVVYDIGAGTGSVSVELARKAFDGVAYAIEMKAEACDLISKNRIKHGAYNLEVIHGNAPQCLDRLPKPDKVFIGGSSGNISDILKVLINKNPHVQVVSNAVSLQGISNILKGYEDAGFCKIDTVCVNISKAKKIKAYDIMQAQNPVYIVTGKYGDENE